MHCGWFRGPEIFIMVYSTKKQVNIIVYWWPIILVLVCFGLVYLKVKEHEHKKCKTAGREPMRDTKDTNFHWGPLNFEHNDDSWEFKVAKNNLTFNGTVRNQQKSPNSPWLLTDVQSLILWSRHTPMHQDGPQLFINLHAVFAKRTWTEHPILLSSCLLRPQRRRASVMHFPVVLLPCTQRERNSETRQTNALTFTFLQSRQCKDNFQKTSQHSTVDLFIMCVSNMPRCQTLCFCASCLLWGH